MFFFSKYKCQACRARISESDLKCESCGAGTRFGDKAKQQKSSKISQSKWDKLLVNDLVRPPRRVPFAHALSAFSPVLTSLITAVFIIAMQISQTIESIYGASAVILPPTIFLLWMLFRGVRRYTLLRNGIASRAEYVKGVSHQGRSWGDGKIYDGWDMCATSYSYNCVYGKKVLRLSVPDGDSTTIIYRKSWPYKGEIFLLDPKRPSHNSRVGSFSIPLRPDSSGQWKVWPRARTILLVHSIISILFLLAAVAISK
jgi:hypothetical protein